MSETPAKQETPQSRRLRFLGLARATRDTYIPRLAESVTLLTGLSRGPNDAFDDSGRLIVPKDATITLFPSYTRKIDDEYLVDVRGWLWCPGLMTRKNRLILSLAKQLTRSSNPARQEQVVGKLEDEHLSQDVYNPDDSSELSVESDLTSISTTDTRRDTTAELQSLSSNSSSDGLLKQRMGSFIARSLPNIEIRIIVGSEEVYPTDVLKQALLTTDVNGHFETTIRVKYKPSVVQVQPLQNETIFAMQDVMIYSSNGLAIISDIDDTIKLTGVCGDKRDLMRKLLLSDINSWNIPNIVAWYIDFYKSHNVSFHYVSNSPWQLYSVINEYFKTVKLPLGSIHLKQYSGNIITNLMEPSSSRKKKSLYKIVEDFPNKSFICVGDSGEQDLEAYVDLAVKYPKNIKAIFIRYVTDSLSDVDDMKIMKRLMRIQTMAEARVKKANADSDVNLIDLASNPASPEERKAKLPPMVPKKPSNLKGKNLTRKPPPVTPPQRVHTDSDLSDLKTQDIPPPLPSRSATNVDVGRPWSPPPKLLLDLQTIYHFHDFEELEDIDSKGAAWIRRLISAIYRLEGTDTQIKIFTDEDEDFFKTSLEIAQKQVQL